MTSTAGPAATGGDPLLLVLKNHKDHNNNNNDHRIVSKIQISSGEQMNPTKRNTMEDCHVTKHPRSHEWDHDSTFIGVYDGHGGRDIVDFLQDALHSNIALELNHIDAADDIERPSDSTTDNSTSIHERLERAFLITDVQSKMQNIHTSGATVAICIIQRELVSIQSLLHDQAQSQSQLQSQIKVTIHAANAGDARAVLSCRPNLISSIATHDNQNDNVEDHNSNNNDNDNDNTHNDNTHNDHNGQLKGQPKGQTQPQAYRLTSDHKADDPTEIERIENAGGFLLRNRVLGIMAVARSMGDHGMKEFVIARPFCKSIEFVLPIDYAFSNSVSTSASTSAEFVILACDGIWDVMEDWEAVDLVKTFVAGAAGAGMPTIANTNTNTNNNTRSDDGSTNMDMDANIHANHIRQQRYAYERKDLAAKMLCKEAIRRGTTDNITALIAWL